jgi:hypothetical protein
MPKSAPPGIDVDLIEYLHDLPEGAAESIGKLMRDAALAGSKKASRQGWIRLAIESVMIGGIAVGGALRLGHVATTTDTARIESALQAELNARSAASELFNLRLSAAEKSCDAANACCNHQADRLDRLTTPPVVRGY